MTSKRETNGKEECVFLNHSNKIKGERVLFWCKIYFIIYEN